MVITINLQSLEKKGKTHFTNIKKIDVTQSEKNLQMTKK